MERDGGRNRDVERDVERGRERDRGREKPECAHVAVTESAKITISKYQQQQPQEHNGRHHRHHHHHHQQVLTHESRAAGVHRPRRSSAVRSLLLGYAT